jgi:surface protein
MVGANIYDTNKAGVGTIPDFGNSFAFTVNTNLTSAGSSTNTQFRLPLVSNGTINFVVEWGDGTSDTITTFNQAQITHTYPSTGIYNIVISGTIRGFRFANGGDKLKILNIRNWGTFNMTDNASFHGCINLNATAKDTPIISTTSLDACFRDCINFNGAIGNWDVKDVTSFANIFNITSPNQGKFNQYIGNWNTSKATTMGAMFSNQTKFNQDISTKEVIVNNVTYTAWDTSNVTLMNNMLDVRNPGNFNQNIGNWNTSKVTNMSLMFFGQPNFNQDISTKIVTVGDSTYTAWDTLNVTNMSFMLDGRPLGNFNQNIENWNTSKVTVMNSMFSLQPNFNQDISTKVVTVGASTYTAWDTLNVTNMSFMFFGYFPESIGKFNQNIGNWNTSKVTAMNAMFNRQPNFNQDISTKVVTVGTSTYTAWDTLNVTNMSFMFFIPNGSIGNFNQNINNWNTIKVTNMADIFSNQKAFNQLINNWNVSLVTLFDGLPPPSGFMQGKTFEDYSSANYDALLIGWSSRPVQANIGINFGTIKYSSAATAARAILTSAPNNWTIVDGGEI